MAAVTVGCGLLLGCGSARGASLSQLQQRAQIDLSCPGHQLRHYRLDGRTEVVQGCGRQLVYVDSCERIGGEGARSGLPRDPRCRYGGGLRRLLSRGGEGGGATSSTGAGGTSGSSTSAAGVGGTSTAEPTGGGGRQGTLGCQVGLAGRPLVFVDAPGGAFCIDETEVTVGDYAAFETVATPAQVSAACGWNDSYAPRIDAFDCETQHYDPTAPDNAIVCVDGRAGLRGRLGRALRDVRAHVGTDQRLRGGRGRPRSDALPTTRRVVLEFREQALLRRLRLQPFRTQLRQQEPRASVLRRPGHGELTWRRPVRS